MAANKTSAEASWAAAVLSQLGAAKGGRARAAKLSPAQRQQIAQKAIQTRWARYRAQRQLQAVKPTVDDALLGKSSGAFCPPRSRTASFCSGRPPLAG